MKLRLIAFFLGLSALAAAAPPAVRPPVRVLLVTGGCCHDYDFQAKSVIEGAKKFGNFTWPAATALAMSRSEEDGMEYPVIWVNRYRGTRVFGTTFGHGNVTWHDPVFITVVSQGVLWAAGRLE